MSLEAAQDPDHSGGLQGLEIVYYGRVQGVGFRWTARSIARNYSVRGTVQNLPDGSVRILSVGNPAQVAAFQRDLEAEMRRYIVKKDEKRLEITGIYTSFEIV
jgi:acylphosphatase